MTNSVKTNHYTYIIRHINGRYYVGRRSTKRDPTKDPYMGSGKWVKSIKDRSTLTKEIIMHYDTFEELKIAEFELIEKYFLDEYCMNVLCSSAGSASGDKNHNFGKCGDKHPMYGQTHTKEARKKISNRMSGDKNPMYGRSGELSPIYGDKNPNYGKTGELSPHFGKTGELSPSYGRTHTEEARKKISDAKSGENNPRTTITDHIAKLIKIRISEGVKDRAIAEEYNTTINVVSGIRHGRSWKHVTI